MSIFNQQYPQRAVSTFALGSLSTLGFLWAASRCSEQVRAQDGLTLPSVTVERDTTRAEPRQARAALAKLPETLGYVMENIRVENARGIIVQVDTVHGTPGVRDIRESLRPPMLQAKEIVEHFASECDVRHIYHDGISEKTANDFAAIMGAYRALGSDPRRPSQQTLRRLGLSSEEAQDVVKLVDNICLDSAVFELAKKNDHYIFRPCESRELVKEAQRHKWGSAESKAVTERRENVIIQNLVKDESGVSILVLGASHDLANNIREWNAAHPAQQLDYIRLRPKLLSSQIGKEK
jgi:hypothetical protein